MPTRKDAWHLDGCIVAVESILRVAESAAIWYTGGDFGRGEEAHVRAELEYSRLVMRLLGGGTPGTAEMHLKRAHAALDQLWLLHRNYI